MTTYSLDYLKRFFRLSGEIIMLSEQHVCIEETCGHFVLLLSRSDGTRYANFQHDWVAVLTNATSAFLAEAQRRGICRTDVGPEELHILLSAFWTTIYEPFIHGFDWEQTEQHCRIVCKLFNWHKALEFHVEK